MKFSNYSQVRSYLESFIKPVVFERITLEQAKIQDPLARMLYFLSVLGNPQNQFPSVLVGGTAGKGSTTYLISHILKTAGYKTGLAISPHLEKINERIQINEQPISDKNLISIVDSIVDTIELMEKSKFGEPSYFEILVALAFLYFAKEKVDIAVVEVGLGGRYDATNTLSPLISVLTNVSLDHTQILGKTVEQIAREKVGIIKDHSSLRSPTTGPAARQPHAFPTVLTRTGPPRGAPRLASPVGASRELMQNLVVITGVKQPSVVKIVEDKCKEVGVEFYRLGKDFYFKIKKENIDGSVFDLITARDRVKKLNGLRLSLLGKYQIKNASLAIETALHLKEFGFNVQEEDIHKALKTAFFPGRFEVVNYTLDANNYTLVLDGAHNPTKMRAFVGTLKKLYPKNRKIFVIAFKKDKDIKGMLKHILSVADSIIITEFKVTTDVSKQAAMPAATINNQLLTINTKKKINVFIEKESRKALNTSISQYPNISSVIIVTGSLYLVGEIRSFLVARLGLEALKKQSKVA